MLGKLNKLLQPISNSVPATTRILKEPMTNQKNEPYSTSLNYKPSSATGKTYATDGTGMHTTNWEVKCDGENCDQKVCARPCGKIVSMENRGNYTHNPKPWHNAEFLDAKDFSGKVTTKGQHFVKTDPNNRPKISGEDMKNLTEDDLTPNKAADAYSSVSTILEKLK